MKKYLQILFVLWVCCPLVMKATPYNIAGQARVSASSSVDADHDASKAVDRLIRIPDKGEWASNSTETFWGQINYPWIRLDWERPVSIDRIVLYDRPDMKSHTAGGVLHFSDGSKINVWSIANDGTPKEVEFEARTVSWVRFEVTDAAGTHVGLSEIEVFPAPDDYLDYVSWVNPYIETARGRYFFFITGNQPYGMIGAAPLTRNKNQYGGGYNYNSTEILGFPQIHCWMLSGLTVMPVTGDVDPTGGEQQWKDAFWLTQWNLNTLWGLAYPSVQDDMAASLLEYDVNGDLLPRGPCAGGYSYIMTGCPATSLITSAFQKGLSKKWNPEKAFKAMKRNHSKGGMLALGMDRELDFYVRNGYCPGNAGLTIQWAFEDWALAEMAARLGKRGDSDYFHKRAAGWPASFNEELGLILPKEASGKWVHTDPLSGSGYVEANAWQATFGISHDIPRLAKLMGGNDSLCRKLDFAFRQSEKLDFVYGYGNGYVSYANQPGCSNAHVFSHAGKPWLTQYWVRSVKEQAYGAVTPDRGYGGHDEDQGQMGGVSTLMAIGLFSLDGGSARNPQYDITSPVFDEVTIRLDQAYYPGKEFVIRTRNNSPENVYIQSARFNGKPLDTYHFSHADFIKGGVLELEMGAEPNKAWGVEPE
ncbi:MAG: glycoside hydrolase family 92 protein [Parabacteroides sp.]|nr:glycoside hydrolase family 92 protein [Parabacteroides sp.]